MNNLYQGMTLDAVTGLDYERFRNYSPSLGTWISQDPLQYINGADRYQFVMSGPVGATDAWGTQVEGGGDDGSDDDRLDLPDSPDWTPPGLSAPGGYYWTFRPVIGPVGSGPDANDWYLEPKDPKNPKTPTVVPDFTKNPSYKQQQVFRAITAEIKRAAGPGKCPIVIDDDGFDHTMDGHLDDGNPHPGKSLFNSDQNISQLIMDAQDTAAEAQKRGPRSNFQRIVNAGRGIGVEQSGNQTSIYTVITDGAGRLVTAFPGVPKDYIGPIPSK